ncbi:hypothetical protein O1R50_09150 [Glycomyces luteolus]|uniref:Uncharacterized protein n=1 Tax=Glycomyces luteolus TaxID=2670330 RepID=A0A9X3ST25_9ACTN|nr:hypothetical protein [Glycomyces luteolus]MDA1359788.1 hypothetical protein [Glycomyces luteolus]
MIIDGDGENSFDATLAAVLNDLVQAPGDTVMGLYHYGDALEATPIDALGVAVEQEYRTAVQHHTGRAAFRQALRRAGRRMRSGEDLLETEFLWGVAISMRFSDGGERCVRLVAVGVDGTVHWCTAKGQLPPAFARIPDGTALLSSDHVVAGLDAVLDAAVRESDRACRAAVAAMIGSIRGGDGAGDGHAAFGIWQQGGDFSATTLQQATDVLDRHLAATGDIDSATERAAAELATAPGGQNANGFVGSGLVNIDRTGPAPMIVANAVVGTRLHLVAWPLEESEPVEETCPWHELAPSNRPFVNALRALTRALTSLSA